MKSSVHFLAALSAILFFACAHPAQAATILASPDNTQPFSTTGHSITGAAPNGGNVTILQDIALDPSAGPWHKNLVNNTSPGGSMGQIFSGSNVAVTETMANLGAVPWNQWTEKVLSRTTINTPNDSPGFLIRRTSPSLQADYGSGFVPLTQGTHYAVVGTPDSGPGADTDGWEAISFVLLPGSEINPGNKLRISEQVYEVFLDGNIWAQGEAAEIAQFPGVPEPSCAALLTLPVLATLSRRRR
jgi:hypothetical protein